MGVLIQIKEMEFYAYHGFYPEEQLVGGSYKVSVQFELVNQTALSSDNIDETVDYEHVCQLVKEEMMIPSKLLEHVGQRIFTSIAKLSGLENLQVRLEKVNPPLAGSSKNVSVTITQ